MIIILIKMSIKKLEKEFKTEKVQCESEIEKKIKCKLKNQK